MAELDEAGVETLVQKRLDQKRPPEQIISELSAGIIEVGERFRREEYFLSELIYSGEIFKNTMATLQPLCKSSVDAKDKAVVVMGTVPGDIHDLGKNIVITMLECAEFKVVDIGVDAAAQRFVEAVVDSKASLVGMSMLLTTVFDAARDTVDAITQANLRDDDRVQRRGNRDRGLQIVRVREGLTSHPRHIDQHSYAGAVCLLTVHNKILVNKFHFA
jgi:methanogenic corrinoid protein MtbC1